MSKKQIKELVIVTKMEGGKEATAQIKSLETALGSVAKYAAASNKELGGQIKVAQNVGRAFEGIAKSMESVVTSSKALNKALNGDTKTAAKNLEAYIDNLQIATLYMKDLSSEAEKASKNVSSVGSSSSSSELKSMANFIEQIYLEMVDLNEGTRDVIHTLDRLSDRIVDVEVQTKKTRLETEKLNSAYDRTSKASGRASAASGKLANDTRRLAGSGSQGARAFSDLAFRMNPLVSLYASIAVNVYALTEAFRILNEAANLARLNEQTGKFAASLSGINIKALSSDLQELSGYSISTADALRQTVRGVSYGFMVEDMERLTAGARKASIALGVDFADAMDRAFRGISKGEVEILDEIGVVTRLDTAYSKYAVTLGKSADALTDVERRQALTNEVIGQLESRFSAFDVTASGMERLGIATKDTLDSLLMLAAVSFDSTANSIAKFLSGFGGVKSATDKAKESQKIYNEAIKAGRYSQAAVALDDYRKALVEVTKENTKGTKENEKFVESQQAASLAANVTTKALSALILVGAYYAAKTLVSIVVGTYRAIAAIVSYTTANIALAAAGKANIVWTTVYTTALAAKTVALATARSAVIAYSVAVTFGTKATLALLAPLLIVAAKLAALGAIVYGVVSWWNYLSKTLLDFDAFEYIANQVSWLGDKLKELFPTLFKIGKELGGNVLDGVGSATGIDTQVSKLFKLDQGNLNTITSDQVDMYVASLQKNLGSAGPISFSPELAGFESPIAPTISRSDAEANLSYFAATKSAAQDINKEFNELRLYESSFSRMAKSFATFAAIPVSVDPNEADFQDVKARFENLKTQGVIPVDIQWDNGKGLQEFNNRVQKAADSLEYYDKRGAFLLEAFNTALDSSDPTSRVRSIGVELQLINNVLTDQEGLGKNINANQRQALEDKRAILEIQKQEAERQNRIAEAFDKEELSLQTKLAARSQEVHLQSQLLSLELLSLEAKINIQKSEGQNTRELEKQLELMKLKLKVTEAEEAKAMKAASLDFNISQQQTRVSQAGSATSRVAEQEKLLALEYEKALLETNAIDRAKQLMELGAQSLQLEKDTKAASFADFGTTMSSIAGIDGLTELQANFSNTLGTLGTTYSDFLSSMDSQSMSFAEYLGGNLEALASIGQAALGMAQSVYAEISASKIESINQEIAAEQRRDGKSAESLAKIKKLNAQRIKEETKAKKASVMMSTATAIMQAMAQIPFPGNVAVAAATGIMGMVQLANIDKAANGQLAALNTGAGGNLSISGGNRDNSIDVSKAANAGELGYLRGQSGSGTASNFIPGRAGGNDAMAGAAITVGESGPEVIVPKVPVSVQPAGQSSGANITYAPTYHLQAIDAEGMDALMMKHSRSIYAGLETELNANNMTLQSLDR